MIIRKAEQRDLPRLTEIYNDEVLHGTATFDLEPQTVEARAGWLSAHNLDNHPLYVAQEDGTVLGYVSLSPFREKAAYDSTVELSIYLDPSARGRGVGTALMGFILEEARRDERIHNVVSVITGGNEASIRLHEKFGFTCCGVIPEVGFKFGRYLDSIYYYLLV